MNISEESETKSAITKTFKDALNWLLLTVDERDDDPHRVSIAKAWDEHEYQTTVEWRSDSEAE